MFHEESIGLAERVLQLAQARGADDVAVRVVVNRGRQVRFYNSSVDVVKTWLGTLIEVQLAADRRVAVVSTESPPEEEALEAFVGRAFERLRRVPPRDVYAPLPEGPFDYPVIRDTYDPRLEEAQEELVDAAKAGIDAALGEGAKRAAGVVRSQAGHECLLTSGGAEVCERFSRVSMEVRALVDDQATGHGVTCSRFLDGLDPERAGREAGRDAVLASKVVRVPAGRYNAAFWWSAMTTLLGVFGAMASGLRALMQMTPYVDRVGSRVGSELVTIVDDPLMDGGYASRSFDLEGLPTRRNVIIEGGILKTLLHNRLTAAHFRVEPTGNAGWVFPNPWFLRMSSGDRTEEEILEDLGRGIVVRNATYLRFQNYRTGDFSAVIRDGVFLVEGGEMVGAIRGLRLSENVLHMLSNVYAVGREARQMTHWWAEFGPPVLTPVMAVREVRFTSATA